MGIVYLTGFMGAGKTTIGKELGFYLNRPVIDTDEEIERTEQLSINTIFAEKGETFFRTLETKVIKGINLEKAIITTGGGIVIKPENRQILKEKGIVIFLYAAPDEILNRLENDQTRPLLKGDKKRLIQDLYEERMPLYRESADFIIDTTGKDTLSIIKEITNCLE